MNEDFIMQKNSFAGFAFLFLALKKLEALLKIFNLIIIN